MYYTFDLFHGPAEPFPSTYNPETHAIEYDYSHSDDGVVERLRVDRLSKGTSVSDDRKM